ncbi:histidine kinase dimerization/phospho-acceptor domain-containing protein, partial [Photobacterium sanctipauli]
MIRLILLVLTLCGPSLFTLPASAENSAINQSTNTDENTLRYTVGNHLYPAIFLDKATLAPSGYVVDLFKLIESQTGLRFEYIPLADGGSEASMFANKEIDIIPFENPRKARQNFGSGLSTIPYNSQRFLLIELNNVAMKIGIVARTQRAKTYLGDFIAPYQQPVFYNSIESLEADLKANKLDGIFLSEELITPEFLIANHQNITLSNARSITTLTSAMLFQEEHIAQYLKVNHFLTQLDSNTVTNLAKKYSRSEINIGYQPKTMAIILFISLLISLAVWLIYQKKHRSLEGALSNERARKRKADLAVDWFSSLLEGLPVGMLLTDKNGNELISNKLFRNKYNQYPLPNLDNLASKGVWSPEDQSVHFNFYKTDILHPESKELCHLILWDDVPQLEKQKSELASAHRVATDALAARARFTAMISHELKTPISGMQGSLELLHRKIHLEPENQVLIESVIQSAEQLERQLS